MEYKELEVLISGIKKALTEKRGFIHLEKADIDQFFYDTTKIEINDYRGEGFLETDLAEYDFKVNKVCMLLKGGADLSLQNIYMITEKVIEAYESDAEEVMFKVDVDEDSDASLEEIFLQYYQ